MNANQYVQIVVMVDGHPRAVGIKIASPATQSEAVAALSELIGTITEGRKLSENYATE